MSQMTKIGPIQVHCIIMQMATFNSHKKVDISYLANIMARSCGPFWSDILKNCSRISGLEINKIFTCKRCE